VFGSLTGMRLPREFSWWFRQLCQQECGLLKCTCPVNSDMSGLIGMGDRGRTFGERYANPIL
jgi:hypothetical protein